MRANRAAVDRRDVADAELVAALCARRPEAARQLYDTYGRGIYCFVHRRTHDSELSREIVQDVMVSAWQHVPRFDPEVGTFRSWLFRIARNAVIDAGRRDARRPRLVHHLDPEGAEAGPYHVAEPCQDDVEVFLRSWVVRSALDRLPTDHRTVVELVYFRQLKVAEAAARLGIPEGTVKSRCYYALQNLRSALSELGVVDDEL